jgi:serine protease Do
MTAVAAVCLALATGGSLAWANVVTVPLAADAPKATADAAKAVESAIEKAADRVAPAVANIIIMREATSNAWDEEFEEPGAWAPDDLRQFFDRFRRNGRPPMRAQGNGSGFVISSDGFILTSEHVVRDAVEIEVTLATRKKFKAKVVGSDARRDLAVIRIQAKDLPVAPLGDASVLKRGQFVLALGSPFGFGRDGQASVSFGIVSGTGRAIPGIGRELDRYYGNLIQTDTPINPGNSGGPLINIDGEVVGVNAVISSQTGSSNGVGFAVPITAETRRIIDRLKAGEEIVYGYVGVEIQEVGEDEAKATGAELGQGAFVAKVLPDAPGAKAGVKEGDIIVAVGDRPVRDPDDVIQVVQATPVGEKIALTVLRKNKKETLTVEVARRPGPKEVLAARETGDWWRGLRVEPLTIELRAQAGLKETDQGAFVSEVRDGSPAADTEIVPGMVIDQVGDKKVASVKEFRSAVAGVQGPCFVHITGIGVKVIQSPGAVKPEEKPTPEKPKGKGKRKAKDTQDKGGTDSDKPADKPAADKPSSDKPAADAKTPESKAPDTKSDSKPQE